MSTCIYWLKRDFRLSDNPALSTALSEYDTVVPLFLLEPSALAAAETSVFHVHAQCDAFNGLHAAVTDRGGQLAFAHAEVVDTLDRLFAAHPFETLISHQETGNNRTYARDRAVAAWCEHRGIEWREPIQTAVFRGGVDRDKRHKDWKAFTEADPLPVPADLSHCAVPPAYAGILIWLRDELQQLPQRPPRLPANPAPAAPPPFADVWLHQPSLYGTNSATLLRPENFNFALTEEQRAHVQPVNETAANVTLRSFHAERASNYSKGMSSPNTAFYHCSRLSVHLAWGTLTVREAYQRTTARIEELKQTGENAGAEIVKDNKALARNLRSFLSRLHWHDHFTQRLETEVEMEHRPLNPNFWELELEKDPEKLTAWITGRTGFPMVDACIRCMQVTGYINFRMRSMLTSTAAHMLHLDFRQIDKPMARLYTDYEPGIHLAQLQMQAGMVGINTLRTYSPEKQFLDHDPEARFVHRWIPELRGYTAKEIAKRDLSVGLGDYPPAIVDRTERVKAYKKIIGDLKYREGGRELTQAVFEKHGSRRGPRKRKKQASG